MPVLLTPTRKGGYMFVVAYDSVALHIFWNRDLDLISYWTQQWLVTYSSPKTESMLVSNKMDRDFIPDIGFQIHMLSKESASETWVSTANGGEN